MLEKFVDEANDSLDLIKVDIDDSPDIALEYEVDTCIIHIAASCAIVMLRSSNIIINY